MHLNNNIGDHKHQLDTPILLIDLDIMESNIAKMADYFSKVKANLRPHTKTHKTPILAHKQIDAGAIGITCAKLDEAEVMVASGLDDILIANEIISEKKITKLAGLARHANIMVAVDDANNVENLSNAVQTMKTKLRILIEVNTGMNRCGVLPGKPALELARIISRSKNLVFSGLMGYEGHTVTIPNFDERKKETEKSLALLIETKDLIEKAGIEVEILSGGGTGTYNITGQYPGVTEVQAGSYIFMDTYYRNVLQDFDCALTILTTVISHPNSNTVIVDAGLKSVTKEFGMPEVKNIDGAKVVSLSEEHGKIDISESGVNLKPGDKIELIPSHCCTTINLHDQIYGIRNDILETIWHVAGRGKVR